MAKQVRCDISDRLTINTGDGPDVTVAVSDVIRAIRNMPGLVALAELVAEMRQAQKDNPTRSYEALTDRHQKERQVDEACRAILDGQKKLF